jgi:hypothetical protein
MAENKTKPTTITVSSFLGRVKDSRLRKDCETIIEIMESVSGLKPVMWGSAIIGFGTRHYIYESGREGDTMILGFSPRAKAIVLYLCGGLDPLAEELAKLGKHTTGKGCLYIKTIADVDTTVLRRIVARSWKSGKFKD